ncbi:ABC transporter substrate-binding protein, partial [Dermatophilus congolensis]
AAGPSLFPADITDDATRRIAQLIYRGLYSIDPKGKAVPGLANTMTTSDHTTWTAKIDPRAQFADGTPITAEDIAASWTLTATRTKTTGVATPLTLIEGYDEHDPKNTDPLSGLNVINPTTLQITLTTPTPRFNKLSADITMAPFPAKQRTDPTALATKPTGNGPYRLEKPWTGKGTYTLRPNSTYMSPQQVANTGIEFHTYDNLDTAYLDLRAGKLDVIDELPPNRIQEATDAKLQVAQQPVGMNQTLDFPTTPEWQGIEGRNRKAAIGAALDRNTITETNYDGATTPATDLASPVVDGYSNDICGTLCVHDPDQARALWSPNSPHNITIAYLTNGTEAVSAGAICSALVETLPITCDTRPYPNEQALANVVRNGKINGPYLRTWRMRQRDLGAFLEPRYSPDAQENWNSYTDPLAELHLRLANAATKNSAAMAAQQEAERYILRGLPSLPLWSFNATTTSTSAVTGVVTDPTGVPVYTHITRPPQ